MVRFEIPEDLAELILEMRDENSFNMVLADICRAYEAATEVSKFMSNERKEWLYYVLREYTHLVELLSQHPERDFHNPIGTFTK